MTRPIDRQTFERSLVNYASPTLANIKAAALFTFPGPYARTNSQARSAHKIEKRRRELLALIDRISQELNPKGINIRVLVWRSCGALIYMWRPRALAAHLTDGRVQQALEQAGYDTGDTDTCLEQLARRIAAASKRKPAECALSNTCQNDCPCEFPHEIGFFLDYPTEDVLGFIGNEGRNYLAVGPWKVYSNLACALDTFERYARVTRTYQMSYQRQGCLARLTVA